MILPDGSILGTETGVILTYLCDFRHHMQGSTRIESVCGEDGTWTNLNAACSYGKKVSSLVITRLYTNTHKRLIFRN